MRARESLPGAGVESAAKAGLRIGGFVPFSTTDYPGRLSAVVFCQGCPWRCVYCHNPHLLPAGGATSHSWMQILSFLERRRGLLDAVVFSGGEPTLQAGLADAMREVKAMGFMIGLHTAGMYPRRLARILPLADWIGLDVKAPQATYPRITGVRGSGGGVFECLDLILSASVDYQLRCTWHPELLPPADLEALGDELRNRGVDRLTLQICRPRGRAEGFAEVPATALTEGGAAGLALRAPGLDGAAGISVSLAAPPRDLGGAFVQDLTTSLRGKGASSS